MLERQRVREENIKIKEEIDKSKRNWKLKKLEKKKKMKDKKKID